MRPTNLTFYWQSWVAAAVTVGVLSGCATTNSQTAPIITLPVRGTIEQRLQSRLETDPNRALCVRVSDAFRAGHRDALRSFWDFRTFVDRIVAHGNVPETTVAQLRADPAAPQNFARYLYPDGSQFRCLGTRMYRNEPHLVIRQWTSTRYDYLLLRLTGQSEQPFNDYQVVSSGYLHSEAQAFGFNPAYEQASQRIGRMLEQSYQSDFAGIISAYQALPQAVQDSPFAFFHFINAVVSSEQTGSELYRDTMRRLDGVMAERVYSLAYWHLVDARRRGDSIAANAAVGQLVELLDDYELLQE